MPVAAAPCFFMRDFGEGYTHVVLCECVSGLGSARVWGKIIGGMAGFAMGGPFGAVMGAAFGHAAETRMGAAAGWPQFGTAEFSLGFTPMPRQLPGGREQLFALGVVVLAAKVAKVDGPVRRPEIDAFKRSFRIPPEAVSGIGALFDRARDSDEDPLVYARQLGDAFADDPDKLEDVLCALFAIAQSDGAVNVAERDLLSRICQGFRLGRAAWDRASGATPRRAADTGEDPYAVLGLGRDASPEQLRATWKRLMRENHPDSLASQGVAPDLIARASDKVARINAAWDRIKRERGL
jgi:DnaJ like chaperone protein